MGMLEIPGTQNWPVDMQFSSEVKDGICSFANNTFDIFAIENIILTAYVSVSSTMI